MTEGLKSSFIMKSLLFSIFFLPIAYGLETPYPSSLPTPDDLIKLNFKSFREYIYIFTRKSNVINYSNGCRRYEFQNSRNESKKYFNFCIFRKRINNALFETLTIKEDSSKEIKIIVKRTGDEVTSHPNSFYYRFDFPLPSNSSKYQIILPDFNIQFNGSSAEDNWNFQFNYGPNEYHFTLSQKYLGEKIKRRYYCNICKKNHFDGTVITKKINNSFWKQSYYFNYSTQSVAPYMFNNAINAGIINPIKLAPQKIIKSLIKSYGWPSLGI